MLWFVRQWLEAQNGTLSCSCCVVYTSPHVYSHISDSKYVCHRAILSGTALLSDRCHAAILGSLKVFEEQQLFMAPFYSAHEVFTAALID